MKHTTPKKMGCLKLAYYKNKSPLKVVHRSFEVNEKSGAGGYRYGFNGKESDNEVSGSGNQYDYGFRIYNPRLGKFLSVDPLTFEFPFYSPYQFASNMPILAIDIDGLESSKILNYAEILVCTPYEFGGKNPHSSIIGLNKTIIGEQYWKDVLLPYLKEITKYYSTHYKSNSKLNEVCTEKEIYEQQQTTIKFVYSKFSSLTQNGTSLGIDCSGFVYKCYSQDNSLLMNSKLLNTGSAGQLSAFKKAESNNQAIVHKDFNLISSGDFVYKKGHVVIATGNVKVDQKGNVISFETKEAHDTNSGAGTYWNKADNKKWTIGHPFRETDIVNPNLKDPNYSNCEVSTNKNSDRLKNNLEQNIIK